MNSLLVYKSSTDLDLVSLFMTSINHRLCIHLQGTFSAYYGLNSSALCTPCTAGQYCGEEGLNRTSGPCEPGFFCPGGQNSSRPADFVCFVGHYCPLNSSQPLLCPSGMYMNHTMASECYICPAGWYVNGSFHFYYYF